MPSVIQEVPVALRDAVLPEFDHEMGTTRRLLERVPEGDLAWKPHPKSMSLGELASHLVDIPGWAGAIMKAPSFDMEMAGDDAKPKAPAARAVLLERFDRTVAEARAMIAAASDGEWMAKWTLKKAGQDVFSAPRVAAAKSFLVNHSIHHRGQLSVYLRLRNVPVPSIYGPSADEGGM
jgi:uncharacterized damage-inducible protein DinB